VPAFTRLHTKNLFCAYDNGKLWYIKAGSGILAGMIYSAVRDTNWETIPYHITEENIQQNEEGFAINYTAQFRQNNILFEARYRIEGRPDDSILFEMAGTSHSHFFSNRIGLCIHLPADECKSLPVTVTTDTGEKRHANFPANISPHQPFSQIRQMRWQTHGGKTIQLFFEGDIFEAEDQRNWMDNSYKIYSRPLHLPFPFIVEEGFTMRQKLLMQFSGEPAISVTTKRQTKEDIFVPLPAIGLAAANEPALLSMEEIKLLNRLPFVHYRVELYFETDWTTALNIHASNAFSLNVSLEIILFFSDNYEEEAKAFVQAATPFSGLIKSVLPLHKIHKVTPVFLQQYFYPLIKKTFPEIKIGYGTDAYFAELNRQRPASNQYDFVSFSINPQVHVFDSNTLLENTGSIQYMLATIQSFTNKPVYISPITFRKRKNHDSTSGNQNEILDNSDERQHTWFGAGFFLLCLYALHDAAQATFFTTTGESGVLLNSDETSPLYLVLHQLKLFSPVAMKKNKNHIIFKNEKNEEMIFSFDELFFS
jgi:hypothetical protein